MDDIKEIRRIEILGVPVDMVDMDQAVRFFDAILDQEGCSLIVTPNSEIIVMAQKDKAFRDVISSADLVIPDGIGLVYGSRLLGHPLHERVTGIDFLGRALHRLAEQGKSAYFLGARHGVAEQAAERMIERYKGLRIAGTRDGFFGVEEEATIVEEINLSGADLLCVALGAPKQEMFIARYREHLKVKAAIGVGGSLDVFAGTVKRAPVFYQKYGLEWLYRLAQQPSRYKRVAVLPLFMIKLLVNRKNV